MQCPILSFLLLVCVGLYLSSYACLCLISEVQYRKYAVRV